jgi:hypothetical protein
MPKTHNYNGVSQFHDRLIFAWFRWQALQGRQVQQTELGEAVAKLLNRKPVTSSSVSRWFTEAVPDLQTIAAIAKVLGVCAGWLAFGADCPECPPPENPAMPTPMPRPKS